MAETFRGGIAPPASWSAGIPAGGVADKNVGAPWAGKKNLGVLAALRESFCNFMEDIFDIVNDSDQVIGSAPRGEVHARGLKHRAAHILVYNAGGQLLIQLRSPSKDRHPNTWDSSAAGHVDSGETYDAAAHRELREELGVTVSGLKEIAYLGACEETGQEFVKVYEARHDGPFQLQAAEVAAVRWIGVAELERWMNEKPEDFAPALPYLWKKIKS